MSEIKEGWAVDITSSNATHYYKDGISLCKKKIAQPFFSNYDKDKDYSQVLGYVCSLCRKKNK